ncbi:WD40-repeat-containing domain protein [Mucor mucedo]|uniref:WD40-repeat-containing domain protein n=1 Tax=Mucor mucedo TaxID=29922 RepID=UPI002220B29F|nr:WD40-repeat-containing domain protein [Mucor mucedo]KAI7889821.1 WD40-repeat-containing domain protein [Mucor mucedo]
MSTVPDKALQPSEINGVKKSPKPTKVVHEKTQHIADLITSGSLSATRPKRYPTSKRLHSLDTDDEFNKCFTKKTRRVELPAFAYNREIPVVHDMESTRFKVRTKNLKTSSFTEESVSREAILANVCGYNPHQRTLCYTSDDTPAFHNTDLKNNIIDPKIISRMSKLKNRNIDSSPENVLDAPLMKDDFYLNLLSWSKKNVVAIGLDTVVYLWNADNEDITVLKHDAKDQVNSLSWSEDGECLAVGSGDGKTLLYDINANEKVRTMVGQEDGVGALSWHKHILSSGANKTVFDRDVRLKQPTVRELHGHKGPVCGLSWNSDGRMLASGGADNLVNVWDNRKTKSIFTIDTHTSAVKALAWCPWNHNLLATGGGKDDKKINFWRINTKTRTQTIQCDSPITSIHWSRHFRQFVSTHGHPQNHVTVWDYPSLDKVKEIPAHDARILHSHLSPDGQVLATASPDENLKFWRIFTNTGEPELVENEFQIPKKKATPKIPVIR